MPLLLKHTDVHHLLHTLSTSELEQLGTSLASALLFPPTLQQPPRQSLISGSTTALVMPCTLPPTVSIKTVSLPASAAPKATLTLLSSESGALEAVISADDLTAFRTALVAVLYLQKRAVGRPIAQTTIFGTGKIAYWTARLLRIWVAPTASISVVGRGNVDEVKQKFSAAGVVDKCVFVSGTDNRGVEEVLATTDAVFCCTPSTEPLFPKEWLKLAGKERAIYISLIGSYKPHMKEIEPEILNIEGVKTLVDSKEASLREAGELRDAGLGEGDVVEIGKALEAEVSHGVVVFKCVGLAVMDLVAGRELVNIATERGVGTKIEGYEE